MKIIKKASNFLDHAEDYAVWLAAVIIVFIIIEVSINVTLRALFNHPISWTFDISSYLLLYIPFLAAAWVLRRDGHVRIDIVYNAFPQRMRHIIDIINAILGMLIFLGLTYYGSQVTANSISKHIMQQTIPIPTFLTQIIMPIGSFLLFLQYLKNTISLISWDNIKSPGPELKVKAPKKNAPDMAH